MVKTIEQTVEFSGLTPEEIHQPLGADFGPVDVSFFPFRRALSIHVASVTDPRDFDNANGVVNSIDDTVVSGSHPVQVSRPLKLHTPPGARVGDEGGDDAIYTPEHLVGERFEFASR